MAGTLDAFEVCIGVVPRCKHGFNELSHDVLVATVELVKPHREATGGESFDAFRDIATENVEKSFGVNVNRVKWRSNSESVVLGPTS